MNVIADSHPGADRHNISVSLSVDVHAPAGEVDVILDDTGFLYVGARFLGRCRRNKRKGGEENAQGRDRGETNDFGSETRHEAPALPSR